MTLLCCQSKGLWHLPYTEYGRYIPWRSSSYWIFGFTAAWKVHLCILMEQWRPSHRAPGCIFIVLRPFYLIFDFNSFGSFAVLCPHIECWTGQFKSIPTSQINCGKPEWDQVTLRVPRKQYKECVSSVLHGLLNLVKCNSLSRRGEYRGSLAPFSLFSNCLVWDRGK